MDHDHTDLSQQPAKSVPEVGETAIEVRGATGPLNVAVTLRVDFNVDAFHVARSFSNVNLILIPWVGADGEYLGLKLDGAAVGVVAFRSLAGGFFKGRSGLKVVSWVV